MGFWIFMLCMDLIIPFTMIGIGKLFLNNAPKEINNVFGYRTTMSMKNKDTWEFAHIFCGRLWFRCGLVLLLISTIPLIFVIGRSDNIIGIVSGFICVIQLVVLVGSIFPTEVALKKTFDENGVRR